MKTFVSVFAAVLLAGAVLIGYGNYSKREEAKQEHMIALLTDNVIASGKLCVMNPSKDRVEAFRDCVARQKEYLARGIGPEPARIRSKEDTHRAVNSVVSFLEVSSPETKEWAKLLEGL